MRVGGTYRIAVEALGLNLLAASALDGVIKADNYDTPGNAHRHQESEQQSTGGKRRPDGPIQDAMICLKICRGAETHNP
jgi:hypothetical protein